MFPEIAEIQLSLQIKPSIEKEKENCSDNSTDTEKNVDRNESGDPGNLNSPPHLNGSLKIPVTENNEQDVNNKRDVSVQDEYVHSLWKWPAGRGKFTKVCILYLLLVFLGYPLVFKIKLNPTKVH